MITITLTDEQQVTLDIILGAIGGNPKTSARYFADEIYNKIRIEHGFNPYNVNSPKIFQDYKTSIYFENESKKIIEKWSEENKENLP